MTSVEIDYQLLEVDEKFYAIFKIVSSDKSFAIFRYGKKGTNGQLQVKEFSEINHKARAAHEVSKCLKKRRDHGYKDVDFKEITTSSLTEAETLLLNKLGTVHYSKVGDKLKSILADDWTEIPESPTSSPTIAPVSIVEAGEKYSPEEWGTW